MNWFPFEQANKEPGAKGSNDIVTSPLILSLLTSPQNLSS